MMHAAYKVARDNYKAASEATFKTLTSQFSEIEFDTLHSASMDAMRLHIASITLAERIWAKSISYDRAAEILRNQFSGFQISTLEEALSNAYSDTR